MLFTYLCTQMCGYVWFMKPRVWFDVIQCYMKDMTPETKLLNIAYLHKWCNYYILLIYYRYNKQ